MKPYLSIVVAGRNDNYGGDFNFRLQNCINWFVYYANKHALSAEFIIVNYNPIPGERQLNEILVVPPSNYVKVRFITVSGIFHEKISADGIRKRLPLYEYVAKNIGIRRAAGEYILSANPDILFDPHIIKTIARGQINEQEYYRADRCNFEKPKDPISVGDLNRVRNQVKSVCAKGKDFLLSFKGLFVANILYYKTRSYLFRKYYFLLRNNPFLAKLMYVYVAEEYMCYKLHTNAAGDFLMMHRNNWEKLKGHPEKTLLPVHVDSISVAEAKYSGLKEHVFFYPIYHQEHESRFRSRDEDEGVKKMYALFEYDAREMEARASAKIYNQDDWGFPSEKFEEMIIEN